MTKKNILERSARSICFFAVFNLGLQLSVAKASVSLDDAFRATTERNEDVASESESVIQAEARYSQAKAALFPSINAIASIAKQDTPPAGTGSAISPAEQKVLRINVTQPLFRGFREWAGLRQQAVLSESAKYSRDQALTQLYMDVSEAYFQTLLAQQDLIDLKKEFGANRQRREELLRFRKLGRSRATEVLSLEANLASLEAQLELSSTNLVNSRTAFSLLTGLPSNSVLEDREVYPATLAPLSTYLSRIEERADIRALQKATEGSDEGIAIARGGHYPSIDLSGNYYFERPGVLKDVKWDVMLSLTFPIFQGGAISSQTTQAASIHKQTELALAKARRIARQQIETLYASIQSDRLQMQKWKLSVDASSKSYQAQLRDYRLGIVNNLEVLQALTLAQTAQRSYDRSEIQYKTDYIRLLGASAERPRVDEVKKR